MNVTAFSSGRCLAQSLVNERARRAAVEVGDKVAFREIDVAARSSVAQWGTSDAVFVDGKNPKKGPPPSYESLRKAVAKRVRRLP